MSRKAVELGFGTNYNKFRGVAEVGRLRMRKRPRDQELSDE
jgi:hypothetical protein